MTLPIPRTMPPMEATSVAELPEGEEWQNEPKWDGFRCLAFRDGATIDLRSKSGKPLGRYFPEVVEALLAVDVERLVLDGEFVAPVGDGLSFDALLQRIHPAASRIARLASETPSWTGAVARASSKASLRHRRVPSIAAYRSARGVWARRRQRHLT